MSTRLGCRYSDEDKDFILENMHKMTCSEMASHLGRSPRAVSKTLERWELKKGCLIRITNEEASQIKAMWGKMTAWAIAKELGISNQSVYRFADKHNLARARKGAA